VAQYRQLIAACREPQAAGSAECAPEAGRVGDAQVQSAILKANADENAFLEKWGSEAFVGLDCR
jgi:hypothetical protein